MGGQSIETVTAYIETVEPNWRIAYQQVLDVVSQNLPAGFELKMQYGMPTFVVPLSVFPEAISTVVMNRYHLSA